MTFTRDLIFSRGWRCSAHHRDLMHMLVTQAGVIFFCLPNITTQNLLHSAKCMKCSIQHLEFLPFHKSFQ